MSYDHLKDWIGRTDEQADVAAPGPLHGLAAMLDHADSPWMPGELPPLAHWLYFLPRALERDIGPDGHPKRGGFLPPVPLPRRMWAGGEFEFLAAIPVGAAMTRRSTIADVRPKTGRGGDMIFVRVEHAILTDGVAALREVHTIVYRDAPKPGEAPPPPEIPQTAAEFSRDIVPDPVLLFRYSALTFNGHRIHYDRGYCRDVEGYPGLVVHGPLTATLLMDLYLRQHPDVRVRRFSFRATRPLFDTHPFQVGGARRAGGAVLWARDHEGAVAMTAELDVS